VRRPCGSASSAAPSINVRISFINPVFTTFSSVQGRAGPLPGPSPVAAIQCALAHGKGRAGRETTGAPGARARPGSAAPRPA
jgi:hypothetical protein